MLTDALTPLPWDPPYPLKKVIVEGAASHWPAMRTREGARVPHPLSLQVLSSRSSTMKSLVRQDKFRVGVHQPTSEHLTN